MPLIELRRFAVMLTAGVCGALAIGVPTAGANPRITGYIGTEGAIHLTRVSSSVTEGSVTCGGYDQYPPPAGGNFCFEIAKLFHPDAEVFFRYSIDDGKYHVTGHAKVPSFGASVEDCQIVLAGTDTGDAATPYVCNPYWRASDYQTSFDPQPEWIISFKPTEIIGSDTPDQRSQQNTLLGQLCGSDKNTGACRYAPSSLKPDLTKPAEPASSPYVNCTSHESRQSLEVTESAIYENSIGGKVSGEIGIPEVVKVGAEVEYHHTWTNEKTKTQTFEITVDPGEEGGFNYEPVFDRMTGDFTLVTATKIYKFNNVYYDFPPGDGKPGTVTSWSKKATCGPGLSVGLPNAESGGVPIRSGRPTPATVNPSWCLTDGFAAGVCPLPADLSDLGIAWPAPWASAGAQDFVHWEAVVQASPLGATSHTAQCPSGTLADSELASGARREAGNDVFGVSEYGARGWNYSVPAGTGRYQFWGTCETTGAPHKRAGPGLGPEALRARRGADGIRTIYVSLPLLRTSDPAGRDMETAAELALADHQRSGSAAGIQLRVLSDADPKTGASSRPRARANARRAAADPATIGYFGDANSSTTAAALPILNRAGVLTVSPSSTAVSLTANRAYRPTGRRTFARIVPNDLHQASALARTARADSVHRVFVVDDRELYGRQLAHLFDLAAKRYGLRIVGTGHSNAKPGVLARRVVRTKAQGVLFAGLAENGALPILRAISTARPDVVLLGGDGLAADERFLAAASDIESRLHLVSPAVPPDTLGPEGVALFNRLWLASGHRPDPYAVNAYEAMDAMLDALEHASGSTAHARAAAVKAFFAIRQRPSVLGTYSIAASGDATLTRYADYSVRGGALESPFCVGC